MGEPIHQLPCKRPMDGWKRWIGVPSLERYMPNGLNDEQAHYMNDNRKRILQQKSKEKGCLCMR